MPSADLIKEAERQMTICNACRYCEGYCAVFPAMERRRAFSGGELIYLANLCFDCRACYYACQFAPPHEFAINVPKIFTELRTDTYRDYSWPRLFSGAFKSNARLVAAVTTICALVTLGLVLLTRPLEVVLAPQVGAGAFYRIVPYAAMVLPASAVALYSLAVLCRGGYRFWRETHSNPAHVLDARALVRATSDALSLRYLRGGGYGCNYPDSAFSQVRRWYHHLVFYGFVLDLASTTLAAGYDHFLDWQAPYPVLSWPVVLGTLGGVMLSIGCIGLLALKWRSDRAPAGRRMVNMDVAFLALLLVASVTGLVLLAVRQTGAMGVVLAIHLGVVAGLFLTVPYGKFAHVVYRYAALVRNGLEAAAE